MGLSGGILQELSHIAASEYGYPKKMVFSTFLALDLVAPNLSVLRNVLKGSRRVFTCMFVCELWCSNRRTCFQERFSLNKPVRQTDKHSEYLYFWVVEGSSWLFSLKTNRANPLCCLNPTTGTRRPLGMQCPIEVRNSLVKYKVFSNMH